MPIQVTSIVKIINLP